MNVNKKFDRFKQWAGEKMGAEAKTNTSEDFRALEAEMNLRHDGMERLHRSMNGYVKTLSRKEEGLEKDKQLPVGYLGTTMIGHGQDFQADSEFGSCLISLGRANEALARRQESFAANATTTWLESLERSLAQMKEYQAARKKLEARRLAYDASLAKMQKAKKEDFRVEEELRAQKAKYEESSEDVYRRMEDIKESEVESVQDLTAFLEAELSYHDACREILLEAKRNWPGAVRNGHSTPQRSATIGRPRSNTAHSYTDKAIEPIEESPKPAGPKATIPKLSRTDSLRREFDNQTRPVYSRSATGTDSPKSRDYSPDNSMARLSRVPTEPSALLARTALRPVRREEDYENGGYYNDRADSPTASLGSAPSRTTSWSTQENGMGGAVKKAPPPPPSRAKKPPPPPPVKRATFSSTEIPQAAR